MAGSNIGATSDTVRFSDMANAIRALSMDAVQAANSGHPGMPMGMADAATVLFTEFMKFDPQHPEWPARDRQTCRAIPAVVPCQACCSNL